MSPLRLVPTLLAVAIAVARCGGSPHAPVAPTGTGTADQTTVSAPDVVRPCTIGFDGLRGNGAAFDRESECGVTITAANAAWQVSTAYGRPAPFVQFLADAGTTVTGDLVLQAPDRSFTLAALDIYSSTTKIPYEITGTLQGAVVFTLRAEQGNTYGAFATIVNPHAPAAIDALRVRLTNPAAPCCRNPVGIDNIRIAR